MAIRRKHTSKANSSDNSEYRIAFYSDSLRLLSFGYQRLLKEGQVFIDSDEPDITGELVRCTREYYEDKTAPDWTGPYEVYEESPENTEGRKGKSRKKVDIVCTRTQRKPRCRIKFEAKRLKHLSHPVRIYLGKEGLQEFLTGSYAPESDVAGMLGYVQSDDCGYWEEQITSGLQQQNIELQKSVFDRIDHCYKSTHSRSSVGKEILIFHLLFDFTFAQKT